MACFNCYSSRKVDAELIDKILDRGQRLRSAMVQSILTNDPFNPEIISQERKGLKLDDLPFETNDKIRAFLQGDAMSREDEIRTLETLRSMSATDLCKATDRTYRSEKPCDCLTCMEYQEKDLKCDLKRAEQSNEITQKIQDRYKSEVGNILKFVDSVRVSVNSVVLNEAGAKKVAKTASVGQTFFLEYQIPEVLTRNHQKNRAKVDSGLDSGNLVRVCARRAHPQVINFKQVSVHDIDNLNQINLEEAVITFKLSFRNFKQKQPISLGLAKFSFASFEANKNCTCNQELTLRLSENTPIVVGGLKVSVQLGCGRLYFGKEFIDAVTNNKENSIMLGSDDFSSTESEIENNWDYYNCPEKPNIQKPKAQPLVPKLKLVPSKIDSDNQKPEHFNRKFKTSMRKSDPVVQKKPEPVLKESRKTEPDAQSARLLSQKAKVAQKATPIVQEVPIKPITDSGSHRPVLFGFIYISEAQFSREVMNSYLTCQMFASDDVCRSNLVAFDSNPVYKFSQQFPLVCEDEFLLKLRENFMVVEFFEKGQKDFLIGLAKLPLHQFYLAYRNPVIVKYLAERKLPVIGTDGWESIYHPIDGEVVGQAQFLVALGTKEQIDNLESERGFKTQTVKAKIAQISKTVDVGIQSNMEPSKDIESLLSQISAQKPPSVGETSTNNTTRNIAPEVRSTSELLDSLQKALSIDTSVPVDTTPVIDQREKERQVFKVFVTISGASQLPVRRKYKSKRNKGRAERYETILPSTYVTFQDHTGVLKVTPVVPKTPNPTWDYRTNISLPVEYLTDNQKGLVFKVWRKATNTTTTPNMQVDHVIGFATLDLTVLTAGLGWVQGWFDIYDLSKKCNGQLNVQVTPLEDVTRYRCQKVVTETPAQPQPVEVSLESSEVLSRALKRKFTELDEITQRLRLRLSKVTNDESDTSNDDVADEFERDINTLCVEDDFDMVDFERESQSYDVNHVTLDEVGLLQTDLHLIDTKQKLDHMLEKLSLVSGEITSRYVSGCSEPRTDSASALLTELDSSSRPNLHSSSSFGREMTEKFGCLMEAAEREEGEGGASDRRDNV